MTVLPDTSVWVTFLRDGSAGRAAALDGLLASHEVVVCGPVVAELLAGARSVQRSELRAALITLPWVDLGRREWQQVGELAARLRELGDSVPLTDLEIAVAAGSGGALLWSWDSDFERVRAVLPELRRYDST
ncbi:MAG: PIN domain-containing protein [Candidatus Dormiibacterota bacterium]